MNAEPLAEGADISLGVKSEADPLIQKDDEEGGRRIHN